MEKAKPSSGTQCVSVLCNTLYCFYAQKLISVCIKYVFKCLFYTLASLALKRETYVSLLAMLFCSVLIKRIT